MSDLSDSEESNIDPLDESFTHAADHIQNIHAKVASQELLKLYGLYKQATCGKCNTPKPGILNVQARAKWSAWNDLDKMTTDDAKRLYIAKVNELDPNWQALNNESKNFKLHSNWVVHSIQMKPDEDVEQKPENEKNAFDYIKEGNLERVEQTLVVSQLQEHDENGMGHIHWATDRNMIEILKYLIRKGVDVNMRDENKQTALHYAASCGHLECLKILLECNADSSLKDDDGQTAFDVADNEDIKTLLKQI